jgi:hypothetical protein
MSSTPTPPITLTMSNLFNLYIVATVVIIAVVVIVAFILKYKK